MFVWIRYLFTFSFLKKPETYSKGDCRLTGHNYQVTRGFPSVKLGGVLLTEGKWYYEVKLIVTNGVAQIGWLDIEFEQRIQSHGVGDDLHSWTYDGNR